MALPDLSSAGSPSDASLDARNQELVEATATLLSSVQQAADVAARFHRSKFTESLTGTVEAGKKAVDELQIHAGHYRQASIEIQESKERQQRMVTDRSEEIQQLDKIHKLQEGKVLELTLIVARLERQETDSQRRLAALQTQLGDWEGKIAKAKEELSKATSTEANLRTATTRQKETQATECTTLEQKAREISTLKEKVSTVEAERDEASNVSAIISQAKAQEISNLKQQLLTMTMDRDSLRVSHETSNTTAIADAEEIARLQQRLKDREDSNALLEAALAEERRKRATDVELARARDDPLEGNSGRTAKRPRISNLANGSARLQSPTGSRQDPRLSSATPSRLHNASGIRGGAGTPHTTNMGGRQGSRQLSLIAPHTGEVNRDEEDWIAVDEMRKESFTYGNLPAALFDRIRRQINGYQDQKGWDTRRSDWSEGTAKGDIKCADRFANRHRSDMRSGYACEHCVEEGWVCVAVRKGSVQIRPMRPEDRGKATKADMAYWVIDGEHSRVSGTI